MRKFFPPDVVPDVLALDEWLSQQVSRIQSARHDLQTGKFESVSEFFQRLTFNEVPKTILTKIIKSELERKQDFYKQIGGVPERRKSALTLYSRTCECQRIYDAYNGQPTGCPVCLKEMSEEDYNKGKSLRRRS